MPERNPAARLARKKAAQKYQTEFCEFSDHPEDRNHFVPGRNGNRNANRERRLGPPQSLASSLPVGGELTPMTMHSPKPKVGTNVRSAELAPRDAMVTRYNELNQAIIHGLPELARAYDTLARHLPLLRRMQVLLSQRPKQAPAVPFSMLQQVMGKTVRVATPVGSSYQIPTWSQWIAAYAKAIDYSVRHIRRLVMNEAPHSKTIKRCGWSVSDHNRLIRAATASFDLVTAIEHGADTTALVQEIREIMNSTPEDIWEKPYEPTRSPARRRRARVVTGED
jgi:hypothetical protein